MKRIALLGLSVVGLLSMVVVGAHFFHFEKSVTEAAVVNWQQGASIMPTSADDFGSDSFKQSVRNLHATGANTVTLIVPYYQSNLTSSDIMSGGNTPSDASLISAIQFIHSLGMQVMLKPHLDSYTGEWRALINASDRGAWYQKYSSMLDHLGDIGKQNNAEYMCVGSELISMSNYTSNAANTDAWITMISDLRTHYSGKLTYSANWGGPGFTDEIHHIGFWQNLDDIGISAYFNLYANSTDYNSLKSAWDLYRTRDIEPLYNQYKKPIIFTEVGYRSVSGAHNAPWNYSLDGAYDPQEQANDYQALFKYWNDYPYIAGVDLWQWDSNPNAGGEGNKDYTPQNKLAEQTMTTWFGGNDTPPPPVNPPPTNQPPTNGNGSTTPQNPPPNNPPPVNPPPQNPTPGVAPTVVTLSPKNTGTSATISGSVNMNGGNGHVWFEYGTVPNSSQYKAGVRGINGINTNYLTVMLINLQPHSTYYYRIMAENTAGTFAKSFGQALSFTTQ